MSAREVTIDAKGNIVPKPYGVSRWANPRKYACAHDDCDEPAKTVRPGDSSFQIGGIGRAHNCCGSWHHED